VSFSRGRLRVHAPNLLTARGRSGTLPRALCSWRARIFRPSPPTTPRSSTRCTTEPVCARARDSAQVSQRCRLTTPCTGALFAGYNASLFEVVATSEQMVRFRQRQRQRRRPVLMGARARCADQHGVVRLRHHAGRVRGGAGRAVRCATAAQGAHDREGQHEGPLCLHRHPGRHRLFALPARRATVRCGRIRRRDGQMAWVVH
jgi:hypothetical protein